MLLRPFRWTFAIVLRLAAALAAVGAMLALSAAAIVPGGELTVETDLHEPAPYLSAPKPVGRLADRVSDFGSGRKLTPLVGSPVYFDLTPPSQFDSIQMSVEYANSGHSLVELGALGSAIDDQYDLRPAEARLIDSLAWTRLQDGALTLLQRAPKYGSVSDFIAKPPDPASVAVYMAKTPLRFRLSEYVPSSETRTIEATLRGHHRLFTYIKDEPLAFSFFVQDMNRESGADPVIVSVYALGSDRVLARTILTDDGNTKGDQKASKLRVVSVSLADAVEGAYQIEFTAPNDVFIRRIATRQSKLVFADKMYLGDKVGYSDVVKPLTVYTNGRKLVARTPHLESVQILKVAGAALSLEAPNLRYVRSLAPNRGLAPITSPKSDILLESDGIFALQPADFFNPFPFGLQWYDDKAVLDALGIDYLLTSYRPPAGLTDGLRRVSAVFAVSQLAKTEEGAYRFVLAAPGIDQTKQEVRLARVIFTMHREPLDWKNFWQTLATMFSPPSASTDVMTAGRTFGESPE